jgi:hypothetical protein
MPSNEERAKRWRVTIFDLLALSAGVCLSLGLMKMGPTIVLGGGFVLPAAVGAIIGKFVTGEYRGAVAGALWAFLVFWVLVLIAAPILA